MDICLTTTSECSTVQSRQLSSRGSVMGREEIVSTIAVGAGKSICVLMDRPSAFPGYVRLISLHSDNRIQVAFEVDGLDEGGAYFWATYPTFDALLASLEQFLRKPVQDWQRPYLEELPRGRVVPDHEALATAIRAKTIDFPAGVQFKLQDSYWSQFLPNG